MIKRITIANSKPWCPHCETGYQIARSVTLDATPECEAHIIFEYSCTDCGKQMIFTEEDIDEVQASMIGISTLQAIKNKGGK